MSVLMWVLVGIGVLAILGIIGFFGLVIFDMEKERRVERRHARALIEHGKAALTGKFADNYMFPKMMLSDRTSLPYADEGAFGTADHYLLALAAPFNATRCRSSRTVGGYFDRVKYIDPDFGPVSAEDKDDLRRYLVDYERIGNASHLIDVLEFGLLNRMNYEVSQVLALNGHQTVPEDLADLYDKGEIDSYQRGIDKFKSETRALDLRSYRLVRLIHFARIGATLEWIPERDALDYIRRIGFELRARACRYFSWEGYGEMIFACHRYLLTESHISKRLGLQLKFLNTEQCSPWKKLAFHHDEAQKSAAKTIAPLRLDMPQPQIEDQAFPALKEGRYLEAGDQLIAAPDCTEISRLVHAHDMLKIPQATLDDLVAANPGHAGIHLLAGHHAINAGFEARGNRTANWVSDEAFATLQERARRACDLARIGFDLAPDHHGFVDLVISASDHTGGTEDYRDLWQKSFDLAGSTYLDDLALQTGLMRPLLEKWGGSANASFGMAKDRLARSTNPLTGILFIYAAIEYVILGSMCGGSDDRHKDLALRSQVHTIAKDLLSLTDERSASLARKWLVYWAHAAGDRDMLMHIGPFDSSFTLDTIPWIYEAPTMGRVLLALYSDIAATLGDRQWLQLTQFYEDTSRPTGRVQ